MMTPAAFKRTLRNGEAMLRRRDRGELTRNFVSSEETLDYRLRLLRAAVLESDEVAEMLDNDEKLAARYARFERRVLGLPV